MASGSADGAAAHHAASRDAYEVAEFRLHEVSLALLHALQELGRRVVAVGGGSHCAIQPFGAEVLSKPFALLLTLWAVWFNMLI
jgi:hypothetical protein